MVEVLPYVCLRSWLEILDLSDSDLEARKYTFKLTNFIIQPGLLIFRAVADPRNSGISAKFREIPKKTRNTAKSAGNISKYMSAKHI